MRECAYCGGEHDSWKAPDARCRRLNAFYHLTGSRFRRHRYFGPLIGLYDLAEFLRRMANPKLPVEREFAKRYAHMRNIHAGAE